MTAGDNNWLSNNKDKADTQRFFLWYSPIWMLAVAIVVSFQIYEQFTGFTYVLFGASLAFPCVLGPAIFRSNATPPMPFYERHWYGHIDESNGNWAFNWFRLNIWVGILTFIGNYFLTHYFYDVLGATYTLPTDGWVLNEVPIVMFFMTQPYFITYHILAAALLRRLSTYKVSQAAEVAVLFALSYFTAFMETWSISAYPHYAFPDRTAMYKYGSVFYGLMFVVTYPMYTQFEASKNWSLKTVILHSSVASAAVWILFELWKQFIGVAALRGGLRPPQDH